MSEEIPNGIAVIGMAGRFPGAPDLEMYWQNLRNGVESITHFTDDELEVSPELIANPNYVKARGIMRDVDLFDAEFFGINPREADYTDPQHRLLLETAWQALEDAGVDPERFGGSVGVFAGCSQNTYLLHNLASNPGFLAEFLNFQQMGAHPSMLGNDKDFIATRISYKLNLRGPSIAVQCACSTSLVAIVQACQNLLTYQCDLALAGGVSVTFPQKRGYVHEEGSLVSGDGRCRPFDAISGGTIFGDGVGLVVLKRIDEAIRDGDCIRAVIRGFGVNNDGSTKVSYMAPSVDGQAEAIATAHALADVDVNTIGYVEAHGTGTALGDPIEVAALTKAFRGRTDKKQFCALSAVKGNIGHLEAASGVAGLIKTVLALEHGEIPPTLHFTAPNPRIDFTNSPFYVCDKLQPFPETGEPRRAGVSSFGVGGTNAHLVLEQAPKRASVESDIAPQLFVLSARSATALEESTRRLVAHLKSHRELSALDVAHTLRMGRKAFKHRRAWVSADLAEPTNFFAGESNGKARVAFMFPGQGAQRIDMSRELYQGNAVFRETVDQCCAVLAPKLGLDLRTVIYPPESADKLAVADQLMQTALAQPALFVVEYALAQMWTSVGVAPTIMVGHSIGEYVAAALAGIFSLEDALHLVAARGRLMQSLQPGTMLAVVAAEADVWPLLNKKLSLAAVNGPKLCVVSGLVGKVVDFAKEMAGKGVVTRELKTSHAFHSSMMDPILREFEAEVAKVKREKPSLTIVSSLYGRVATDEEWMSPAYWTAQLRYTVRFADAVSAVAEKPGVVLLEVGPGQTLTTLARQNPAQPDAVATCSRTCKDSERVQFLSAAAHLWTRGVTVDLVKLASGVAHSVPLPTYPFERSRHWIDAGSLNASISTESMVYPESGGRSATASEIEMLIEEQLRIMTKQIEVLGLAPSGRGH